MGIRAEERPVFVPLTADVFESFAWGKQFELRRAERQWNKNQLRPGRTVVLARGYGWPRFYGKIGKRIVFGSLLKIFRLLPYKEIELEAKNRAEAVKLNRKLLGRAEKYVAFEVVVRSHEQRKRPSN